MSDDEKTTPDDDERNSVEDFAEWLQRAGDEDQDPRVLFEQISKIAVCMSYDVIDKIRFWEKETLKLSDDEIAKRLPHMSEFLEKLKEAYVEFADVDL